MASPSDPSRSVSSSPGTIADQWARLSPSHQTPPPMLLEEDSPATHEYERSVHSSPAREGHDRAETEQHLDATVGARDALRAFYQRTGEARYIAAQLSVHYPGEPPFIPDLLAVQKVPLRPRDSFQVAQEGKGLDLVIEVLHHGDRKKDLEDNVTRYAQLGIPEYFVADLRRRRILGYTLGTPEARWYTQVPAQGGRHHSAVLGLDLALCGGQLCFYAGTAKLPLLAEEIDRLGQQVRQEQEQVATAQQEAAAAQQEAAAAQEQLRALQKPLIEVLLTILRLRGLTLTVAQEARVHNCTDIDLLRRWLLRAASAAPEELFLDGQTYVLRMPPTNPARSARR